MKLTKNSINAHKVVVLPTARRGGADATEERTKRKLEDLIKDLNSKELDSISNRILNYANDTEEAIAKLEEALAQGKVSQVESSAKQLINLCSEVGAVQMLRLSYQVLIAAHRGETHQLNNIVNDLFTEFQQVKSQLRIAT